MPARSIRPRSSATSTCAPSPPAVQIHLGQGEYPGHRADRLFGVRMAAVANPALVKGEPGLRTPADLAHHTLLHDDAMEIVAGGNAWQKWLRDRGRRRRGRRQPRPAFFLEHPFARGRVAEPRRGARAAAAGRRRHRLRAPVRALRGVRSQAAIGLLPRLPGGHRRPPGGRGLPEVAPRAGIMAAAVSRLQ